MIAEIAFLLGGGFFLFLSYLPFWWRRLPVPSGFGGWLFHTVAACCLCLAVTVHFWDRLSGWRVALLLIAGTYLGGPALWLPWATLEYHLTKRRLTQEEGLA